MTYLGNSRRDFLKGIAATSVLSATTLPAIATGLATEETLANGTGSSPGALPGDENVHPKLFDGPSSKLFREIPLEGNSRFSALKNSVSKRMAEAVPEAPLGKGTAWGIPFHIPEQVILIKDTVYSMKIDPVASRWMIFLHTSDSLTIKRRDDGFPETPFKGVGHLNEPVADYVMVYGDGSEESITISERYQIGMFQKRGNSFQSVAQHKPMPMRAHHEQTRNAWGQSQTRVNGGDRGRWINWVWAWENPHPEKQVVGFRFEPKNNTSIVISAISSGHVDSNPLRWESRQKAMMILPGDTKFDPELSPDGLLSQIQLDLGQVISAHQRTVYPKQDWAETYDNQLPEPSDKEILLEYTAHHEANFHLENGEIIPVAEIRNKASNHRVKYIPPASQKVKLRILEKGSRKIVPVKLHVHGESDEYLVPVDRNRIPNNAWFEDYSVDFVNRGSHKCTYISGETYIKLPPGKVYIEVSKGFEIKPIRKLINISPGMKEVEIEIEKVLPWREKGWVSADTHVHFLSPNSALLEGSAEGVNIINLLASQWGELFTNVGDFDGRTTLGSKETGGDGEYLVRVGTENRQHVMGHISLLGYQGEMINPLTTGGPDESALGDPIEILLTEWAEKCSKQGGLVILPHFPNPRLENASAIVSGNVHGVEMTSGPNLYNGISQYSLADWYRYLNCGYFVAAVGGTDKMTAATPVGAVRTYARIREDREFTYDEWKKSVKKGNTFASFGPMLNFSVEGKDMGSKIEMSSTGGTIDIEWEVATVTVPLSSVELIVNGEVRESQNVSPDQAMGNWSLQIDKSSWCALLVRGHYPDQREIITAHSSPVMMHVEGSPFFAAADAVTILDQIEGSMAYLETIGTRADEKAYKRMRLTLESSHRAVHNRMHQMGYYHRHSPQTNHDAHDA